MIVKSNATSPSHYPILVDHALAENSRDRSQSLLNEKADLVLRPAWDTWRPLWNRQQQAESQLGQFVTARQEADLAWDTSIRSIGRTLHDTVNNDPTIRRQYLPDGKLDVLSLPLDRQILAMEPYTLAIAAAPDTHLPAGVRDRYRQALDQAKQALSDADGAHRAVKESRTARQEADADMAAAYKAYHQAVEYVCGGNRDLITVWIRPWPEASRGASAQETTSPDSPA